MTQVRLGVLGCAGIATRRMLPAFAAAPSAHVVAVASRDHDKAEQVARQFGCEPVTGYEKLLSRHDIDAVYIPLPAALHASWTERAIGCGKHVLCEKPLTTSAFQTERLVRMADEKGLVLRENFMFPHHSQHEQVRRLIDSGVIGKVCAFAAVFAIPPLSKDDIRYQAELGGGALFDVGVYPLRVAQYFHGPDLAVRGASLRYDHGVDVGGEVLLCSRDGVTVQATFGMEGVYRSSYDFWGSAGHLRLGRAYTPAADHQPHVQLWLRDEEREIVLQRDDQYTNAAESFARAVLTNAHGEGDSQITALADLVDRVRAAAARA
ncbi:oxidoreductase [Rhizocola hellebori]|uniref:Oxidoreductase n=1 Tax=Rhizocola hellebori TaxID=1392758 RepID=A0A8J3VJ06_9ACTN|nr:Gfo/Idh/MocA family oxidoreductase [Rhizocola hellebori]GIH07601.1 oxidoreductase [Rhizocola hellebori]